MLLITAAGLLLGCSGRSGRPATYPVQGNVVYHDKPVAKAAVSFLAPGAPAPAVGTTDESGRFQLTTFEANDGAIPGTHVVTVRKLTAGPNVSAPAADESADAKVDPAAIERAMQQTAVQLEKARSELPAKYADRGTSDLRFEVVDGDNDFEIRLDD